MKNHSLYILKESTNTKEIGEEFPQIQSFSKEYDRESISSYRNVNVFNISKFTPNLDYLILEKKSVQTDVLSTSMLSNGLLISSRLYDILYTKTLNTNSAFFKANVQIANIQNKIPYFWFITEPAYLNFVNYNKTKFVITNSIGSFIGDIEVNNSEQLLQHESKLIDEFKFIKPTTIYLTKEFSKLEIDIFSLSILNTKIIITESLKDQLLDQKINGIEIIKANIVIGE